MSDAATVADVLAGRARWCVVHADSLKILPLLPDRCGVVIQDPPYEAEAHTSQRRLMTGTRRSGGGGWKEGDLTVSAPIEEFPPMTEAERVANGALVARIARRWALTFCQVEAQHLWRASLTATGDHRYVRTCIYTKLDPQPQMTGDRPGMGWETIVVTHPKGKPRWSGGGRCGIFSSLSGKSVDRRDGRSVHPTQKPTELMVELVGLFSEPDEVVIDPYAGSGTTGVAAIRLGRRAILIEKSPRFAAIARERMEAESRGLTLRDARMGQRGLFETPEATP